MEDRSYGKKYKKILIIVSIIIVIILIGILYYFIFFNKVKNEVYQGNKISYHEDSQVDDFVFMSGNLFVENNYSIYSVMVKNESDIDYDIDSIEIHFFNENDREIGSMLYVMEEDHFYAGMTLPLLVGKDIDLSNMKYVQYKVIYK